MQTEREQQSADAFLSRKVNRGGPSEKPERMHSFVLLIRSFSLHLLGTCCVLGFYRLWLFTGGQICHDTNPRETYCL